MALRRACLTADAQPFQLVCRGVAKTASQMVFLAGRRLQNQTFLHEPADGA